MPNGFFMASSLLSAIACVSLAGFGAMGFIAKSDDCLDKPTACIGQSVVRSRSAVTDVVSNWE